MSRTLPAFALIGVLAACAPAQPYQMSDRDSQTLQRALADRTAGEPERCLPLASTRNSQVVDEKHILFKQGRTTWLNQPNMRCPLLDNVGYVMVLEPTVGTQICSGDVAKILDTSTGGIMGACALGDFVPYRTADKD